MATVIRVEVPGSPRTWTVLGPDLLPLPPLEEFLESLRLNEMSPNTVVSYARSLALFWDFLDLLGSDWRDLSLGQFGSFISWLRTGLPPGTTAIGEPPQHRAPSTVATRVAAVLAFYRYQFDANGVDAVQRLYRRSVTTPSRGRTGYQGALVHLRRPGSPSVARPIFRARVQRSGRTPMMTPAECDAIIAAAGVGQDRGRAADLRDRLLFATLHESGMRLGECLALQHRDWSTGAGTTPFIEVVPRDEHPHGYRVKRGRYRRLYISDDLAGLFGEYLWRLCDEGAADRAQPLEQEWVFVNLRRLPNVTRYGAMQAHTVYAKVDAIKRRAAGEVPAGFTPHWFRHTHASTLLLAGVPLHVVMRRLGHLDVQTTLDTYGWVSEDAELALLANWREATAGWRIPIIKEESEEFS